MKLLSDWKLTLDPTGSPVVLLNIGDPIQDEIQWGLSRLVDVVPLVRAASPLLVDGKNVSATLSFTVFAAAAADADSRRDLMASMISALSAAPTPLKIEARGITDRSWSFSSAMISEFSTSRLVSGRGGRRISSYQIIASGFAQTGP